MFEWFVINILPWFISAITLCQMFLAGRLYHNAWLISIGNQFLWATWIFTSENWGLLPLHIGIWYVSIRNHYLWNKGSKGSKG